MKSIVSYAVGGPDSLQISDLDWPSAKPDEVVVDIKAVGINMSDALIIRDRYQVKPERPFSPGGEFAGTIRAVGDDVTNFQIGDRVTGYNYWGAMSQGLALKATKCFPLDPKIPFEDAAGMMITYGTTLHAFKQRGDLNAGETVLVLGASGGVGTAAIQIAKAFGANVIAACSSQEKVELCLSQGADHGLVYEKSPLDKDDQKHFSQQIKSISPKGIDVIYDAIGGDYAEPALRCLRENGRHLVIGFAAGIPKIPLNLTLLKMCDIRGVFWGKWLEKHPDQNLENMSILSDLYLSGKIKPIITKTYPYTDVATALTDLEERRTIGKTVLTF